MATVNKDFKIKHGLVVEGATATVNGQDILTKKQADQDYIVGLIGGTSTSVNTPNTVVKRDASGDFAAGEITASLQGNVTGDVTGTVSDISNHSTSDLSEGSNQYFTDTRAKDAVAGALGDGIEYEDGSFNVQIGTGLVLGGGTGNEIEIDRFTVDNWYDVQGAAAAAQIASQEYADDLIDDASSASNKVWSAYKTSTEIGLAQQAAEGFATQAIANLVDSAPETLDTLNELAAALQDNPDVISDLQDIAAGKQDALTAGDNISLGADGASISVTGLDTDDVVEGTSVYFTNQRALDATSAAYDAAGSAATAEANAIAHADALTTDDVAEGTTQYFTDARAKTSAADLLTGATLDNITITGDENGLVITAENGVADSDTDDLVEGTTNLYFTDARARDAVDGTNRSFTSVELNSVAKQVAATLEAATAGIQVAHAFAKADYRSAEYLVKVAYGTHTEISKVLLTLDTSDNIAITEYGIVGTNGSASTISAGISGDNVQLLVTTANNTSTVTVVGTLLA
jgi:hypothetical protein